MVLSDIILVELGRPLCTARDQTVAQLYVRQVFSFSLYYARPLDFQHKMFFYFFKFFWVLYHT